VAHISSVPTAFGPRLRPFDLDARCAYPETTDDSCHSHLVVLALRAGREPAPGLTLAPSPFRST